MDAKDAHLATTYTLIFSFLNKRSHTKAAEAVKKAAKDIVVLKDGIEPEGPQLDDIIKEWKLMTAKKPVKGNDLASGSSSSGDDSSSSDDSSSDSSASDSSSSEDSESESESSDSSDSSDDNSDGSEVKKPQISKKSKESATVTSKKTGKKDQKAEKKKVPKKQKSKPPTSSSSEDSSDDSSSSESDSSSSESDVKSKKVREIATGAIKQESSQTLSSDSDSDTDSDSDHGKDKKDGKKSKVKVNAKKAVKTNKASSKPSTSSSDSDSSSSSSSDSDSSLKTAKNTSQDKANSGNNDELKVTKKRRTSASGASIATAVISTIRQDTKSENTPQMERENGKKNGGRQNQRFQRVDPNSVNSQLILDNRYENKSAPVNDYGAKAHADLIVTRGAGFRKEKNKKKKGSYRGGTITMESHSFKFADTDD